MESAMRSALVLLWGLWLGSFFCQGLPLELQLSPSPMPCLVTSCICHSPDFIACNATLQFRQNIEGLNECLFLLRRGHAEQSPLVHFRTTESYLPAFLPRLPNLRKLSLADNEIREVQNDVLAGMRLQELDLSGNVIQNIQPGGFRDLQYLQTLDLSHNNLTSVSAHVFSGLPFLRVLNLDFNQLVNFPIDAFSAVPNLRKLTLNENKLSYLIPGSLVSLTAVETLSLRNNLMLSFGVDVADEMPSLKMLDVSGNPFKCGCALKGLKSVFNSGGEIFLKEINQTTCVDAQALNRSRLVSDVINDSENCSAPQVVDLFKAQSVRYITSVELTCEVKGDPQPAVLWTTPWGHQFADPGHWSQLKGLCPSCRQQRRYTGIGINLVSTVSVLDKGKKLVITHFRSFFNGNITCDAVSFLGNGTTAVRRVTVSSGVQGCVRFSMVVGGFCAAGFLCLGLLIGGVKLWVIACKKWFGAKKKVAMTPSLSRVEEEEEDHSVTEDTHCKEDSIDMSDDFYPPETPFTTPIAVSPSASPRKVQPSDVDGADTPPGGWIPTNILETMEEVRWRLRYGVGRKMETVKRNVQTIKETGIRNVQSIKETGIRNVQSMKESGSVYVHNIMESGSTAANKVKAGVVMGVETVKYHVQSIKEFCGTGDMGAQTISMISVETNLDTNETREVIRSVTIV